MKLSKKMSYMEHAELGRYLQQTRDRLKDESIALSHRYGKTTKPFTMANRAVKLIDDLRSEMDNRIYKEHSNISTYDLGRVYYRRKN